MYRAATWKAMEAGADLDDPRQLARLVKKMRIELQPDGRTVCDGVDVTEQIRAPEVTENIFRLADRPAVREAMRERQRQFAERHDLVAEGRDQGTEVFPDADLKFYLSASLEERARRRRKDLRESGRDVTLRELTEQVAERDRRDRSRPVGALRKSDDMIPIDSTNMAADEVVQAMLREAERRLPA
jgi:cytidylate kinase